MEQSKDNKIIPMTSVNSGKGVAVKDDVFYFTNQIVNLIMIGKPGGSWVLIDAGMPKSGKEIIEAARERFGDMPPLAILLTHGHFDHVGSIVALLEVWDVPVYAHPIEFPFLTGKSAYPEPDNTVEGGLLAKISSVYPVEPVDISDKLLQLPPDGSVPFLPGWSWIHVPGHSPGQVAFFRQDDRVLISADAFITVRQDSFYKVLFQKKEVNGPPRYLTTNWGLAKESVSRLHALNPAVVISGHGTAMSGPELKSGLDNLVDNFDKFAVPEHGKFVHEEK